jgi:hypothetical protein
MVLVDDSSIGKLERVFGIRKAGVLQHYGHVQDLRHMLQAWRRKIINR